MPVQRGRRVAGTSTGRPGRRKAKRGPGVREERPGLDPQGFLRATRFLGARSSSGAGTRICYGTPRPRSGEEAPDARFDPAASRNGVSVTIAFAPDAVPVPTT